MFKRLKAFWKKWGDPYNEETQEFGFGLNWFLYVMAVCLWCYVLMSCTTVEADVGAGTSRTDPTHISLGSYQIQKISIGTNRTTIWENTNPPAITTFSVAPTSIDLDTRATGTITFTIAVTGRAGEDTNAQIVRLPDGTAVGTTFSGVNGANISQTLPNIPQPSQTTSYRLIARNAGGSSHRDTTVTVTTNPTLTGCVATGRPGGIAAPLSVTVSITCTVGGYPRPRITINQGWVESHTPDRHFTSTGTNLWRWNDTQEYPNQNQRTFIVTATNSSGTSTATVNFNQ